MSKLNKLLLSAIVLLFANSIIAQGTKGMYVNDFKNIIGDEEKETELLTYAQQQGFNYLLLYNMYWIHGNLFDLTDPVAAQPLADFIERAKTEFGVLEVGAVGEKRSSFDKLVIYNENFDSNPNQQFDIFNIEFEFWNDNVVQEVYCGDYLEDAGLPCDNAGAFKFYIHEIKELQELCSTIGLKSETYIGQITSNQGKAISKYCDRILVHYYRKTDTYSNGNSIYNFKGDRLKKLAPKNGKQKVMPIFASTSSFMGPWLIEHNTNTPFDTYMNGQDGYNEDDGDWKSHIEIDGFQWYTYTSLLTYTSAISSPNSTGLQINKSPNVPTVKHVNHDEGIAKSPRDLSKEKPQQLNDENLALTLYPNPVSNLLHIQCPSGVSLRFMNTRGDLLKTLGPKDKKVLDVSAFANGVYFVSMQVEGQEMQVQKVVVQR